MTAEVDRLLLSPAALGRLSFLADLQPLPLVDPTQAAEFLGVRRHTLACYRSLGEGPPYYKFGRWIRYARSDLRGWKAGIAPLPVALAGCDESSMQLVSPAVAARCLTVTRSCLANYRLEGLGPRYCRLGRRIHYPVEELHRWAEQQRVGPRPDGSAGSAFVDT